MFQTFETAADSGSVAGRVTALRKALANAKVDAFLVPRADEHQGEYVSACAERLRWLTGFSGSAGIAIVARSKAALFIDGRYTVQAPQETDTAIFEVSLEPRSKLAAWLISNLGKNAIVAYDPWLHTISEAERLAEALKAKGLSLKPVKNLVDHVWGKDRPKAPHGPVMIQPDALAGKSAADKIAALQASLKADGHAGALLTLPDSICWLFNVRGSDVAHNPVVLAFAIVPASGKAELYIAREKLNAETKKHLAGVAKIFDPADLKARVQAYASGKKLLRIDPNTAAAWFARTLGAKHIARAPDPCILPKAIKSGAEIAGSRAAHVRDGAAIARFLAWFEVSSRGPLDEITAVEKLEQCRRETNALREISFATISGSGPNGAIVHYRVTRGSNRSLKDGELFLLDSGAQYQDGTTDITRTLCVGTPTDEMQRRYTAVLRGHIAVATARFPKGTRGIDLDPFARRPLWESGIDFDHGTGHGIGSYLSVHEGPQSISRAGMAVLHPGMLISNEPGYYREGHYGIRLENVVLVTELATVGDGDRAMMGFETLSLAPFERRLILSDALLPSERDWLNAYHARVLATLSPLLDAAERAWLNAACKPI